MPRAVQIEKGHLSVTRVDAEHVRLFVSVLTTVSFGINLTLEQARQLAEGLKDYSDAEFQS